MLEILFTWIGATDLRAMDGSGQAGLGPIVQAVESRQWDEVVLLCDYPAQQGKNFCQWLGDTCKTENINLHQH